MQSRKPESDNLLFHRNAYVDHFYEIGMFRLKNQIHVYSKTKYSKTKLIRSILLSVVVKNHRSSCDLDAATLTNLPLVRERVCVGGGPPDRILIRLSQTQRV